MCVSSCSRRHFEALKAYCAIQMSSIPMTFVLGFYVSLVVTRWWDQFMSIPWPDSTSIWLSACITGHDDRGRTIAHQNHSFSSRTS